MALNRKEIIKALKCCASPEGRCDECPMDQRHKDDCECGRFLVQNALALIKELTEDLHAARAELTRVQADTINKFAERLKKYYRALNDYTFSSMVAYHIDQISKEMLEG